MDDNFDREIKDKLDGYEDPSFDEAAFADFSGRLSAIGSTPWYQMAVTKYSGAVLMSFIAAFIIFYSIQPGAEKSEMLQAKQRSTIDSLEKVIQNLQTQSKQVSDSRSQEPHSSSSRQLTDAKKNDDLNLNMTSSNNSPKPESKVKTFGKSTRAVALGPIDQLPDDVTRTLSRKGMLVNDNGTAYLVVPEHESIAQRDPSGPLRIADIYPSPRNDFQWKYQMQEHPIADQKKISAGNENGSNEKAVKGAGFSIAPHADLVASQFSKGHGLLTPRVGLLAALALSEKFSFELGVDYATTSIDFDRDFYSIDIPNLDTSLGTINSAHISNSLVSTPIAIRYQKPLMGKTSGFIRVAYTPYFSIVQEYQCSYAPSYYAKPNTYYGNSGVTSILRVKDHFLYGNTSNVSLGITRLMKGRDRLEGSLFYESSLSAMGNEKLSMSLYGVRAAYWFRVK